MRYEINTRVAAIDHGQARVRLDRASRARTEEHSRQRREVAWAVLSFIALVLCWDLSARLDRRVFGDERSLTTADEGAAEPMRKTGFPRRLRKLSEEAESEAFRSIEWTK